MGGVVSSSALLPGIPGRTLYWPISGDGLEARGAASLDLGAGGEHAALIPSDKTRSKQAANLVMRLVRAVLRQAQSIGGKQRNCLSNKAPREQGC